MGSADGQISFHAADLGAANCSVTYDPTLLSPASLSRLVRASATLCAQVEGLTAGPAIAREIVSDILRPAMLELRGELVAIGAIRSRAAEFRS